MKKMTFVLLLSMLISVFMQGAAFGDIGLKIGLNFTGLKFKTELDQDWGNLTDLRLGAFARFPVSRRFFVQPEMYFSVKGSATKGTFLNYDISSKIRLSYLEVPLLLIFSVPAAEKIEVNIFAGPYAGIILGAQQVTKFSGETQKEDINDEINDIDCGYHIGAEIRFELLKAKFLLDVRYCKGLANINGNESSENTIRNQGLSVMLGYRF